jgi:predicted ATPase
MLYGHAQRDLIGRHEELDWLADRIDAALAGDGCAVFITGEAGIGKSHLVAALRGEAHSKQCWCSVGQCLDYAQAPYHPFSEIARELFPPSESAAAALLGGSRGLDSALGDTSEMQRRKLEVFDAFAETLHSLSRIKPILAVVEDLHWADTGTIELIQHLVPRVYRRRVLFVATCRLGELHDRSSEAAWLYGIRRLGVESLHLSGLSSAETRALILRNLPPGYTLPADAIARIQDLSDGNPLLVQELVRGVLMGNDQRNALSVPESLIASVTARLSRMDPELQRVIVQASVIGKQFKLDVLCATAGCDESVASEGLRQARDLRLLSESAADCSLYEFTHELVRDILCRRLLAHETLPLHSRIAAYLEQSPDSPGRIPALAHHWAAAGDEAKARYYKAHTPSSTGNAGGGSERRPQFGTASSMVEQLTLNQLVRGSSPWRCTE